MLLFDIPYYAGSVAREVKDKESKMEINPLLALYGDMVGAFP